MRSIVSAAGSYRIRPGSIASLFFPGWEAALVAAGMPGFVNGWELHLGRSLDPVTRHAFLANDGAAMLAYFRQMEGQGGVDEASLRTITVPTLLLAGTADTERLADSRLTAELVPGAGLMELAGRDHSSTLYPAAPVLAAVVPFLPGIAD